MATKPTDSPAAHKFLAALTATDQLSPTDKRIAKRNENQRFRADRFEGWRLANAALHDALGAEIRASYGRVSGDRRAEFAQGHNESVSRLINEAERWFAVPVFNKSDAHDRRLFLKQAQKAVFCSVQEAEWLRLATRWLGMVAA